MSSLSAIALAGVLLLGSAAAPAQCPDPQTGFGAFGRISKARAAREPITPETGYLSDTTYTSQFFGFSLDLPLSAQGHLIMLPLMPEKRHALLAIGYQNGRHSGSLTMNAIEPRNGVVAFSAEEQQQKLATASPQVPVPSSPPPVAPGGEPVGPVSAQVGPQVRPVLPGYKPVHEKFRSSVKHDGEKHTAVFWTTIRNYRVGAMVATTDKDFLRQAKRAMEQVRFYCMLDDETLTTTDGRIVKPAGDPYQGPTVPTWRVDAAIRTRPGLEISPGEVSGGFYRNPAIGVQYAIPHGWEVLPANNSGDPPANEAAMREFDFLHACSRTLLRIAERAEGVPNARRPTIVLRALDPVCLSMRTPASLSDTKTAEEVGANLEARSEFGEITSNELVMTSNQLMMVFHGTIAAPEGSDELAQRMAQMLFVTRHNKMLLVWSFIASTSAELNAMPPAQVVFDGSQAIELKPAMTARK